MNETEKETENKAEGVDNTDSSQSHGSNPYQREIEEIGKRVNSQVIRAREVEGLEDLCYHLLMKREFDGLNRRQWNGGEHLRHEEIVSKFIQSL